MVDVAAPGTSLSRAGTTIARAVSVLWWGAMFCLVDIVVGGWDLSSDIVGMLLVAWACRSLTKHDPGDPVARAGLALAVAALIGTVLYSIPATRDRFPVAEVLSSAIAQVGIVVVAAYLAARIQVLGFAEIATRWRRTAQWQAVTTLAMAAFLSTAALGGGFRDDADSEAVFDWALEHNLGLVLLAVSLAVGTIAGVLWLRAAWSTWRRLL